MLNKILHEPLPACHLARSIKLLLPCSKFFKHTTKKPRLTNKQTNMHRLLEMYGFTSPLEETKVVKAIVCHRCNQYANHGNEAVLYKPGPILFLGCSDCNIHWHMCVVCIGRLSRNNLVKAHMLSKKHQMKFQMHQQQSLPPKAQEQLIMPVVEQAVQSQVQCDPIHSKVPHELEKWFIHEPLVQGADLICPFSDHSTEMQTSMLNYHAADLAGQYGGVRFLVSRAFAKGPTMSSEYIATSQESFWHFHSFVQFVSMSEEQEKWQGKIVNPDTIDKSFFRTTWILEFKEMERYYGRSN
jgi:hypothetical protein